MRAYRQTDIPVQLSDGRAGPLAVYQAHSAEHDRPLIYIHGSPAVARMWKPYLKRPVTGTRSIVVDRPGYAGSDWGSAVVRFAEHAAAISTLLPDADAPAQQRPILLGHSYGGPIAARIAADRPRRVAGLVLAGALLNPDHRRVRLGAKVGQRAGRVLPAPFRRASEELHAAPGQADKIRHTLGEVVQPVLIIHGTWDLLVPYSDVAFMQRSFTGAASVETVTLKRAGHFFPWLQPAALRRAVAGFAARLA